MTPKAVAIVGILVSGLLGGVTDVLFQHSTGGTKLFADFWPMLVGLAFIFMWLHYDGVEIGYRRSPLFNIGIVFLGLIFIPVYLYRSRLPGQRLRMLAGFAIVLFLWIAVSATGYYGALAAT
jgi:hypothetical protein